MRSLLKDIAEGRAFARLRDSMVGPRGVEPEPRPAPTRWSGAAAGPVVVAASSAGLSGDLARLLRRLGATSLLDVGCGDAAWLAGEGIGAVYVGVDLDAAALARFPRGVPDASFKRLDARRDPLPRADAVLLRDVLCRMDLAEAFLVLEAVCGMGARNVIATTDLGREVNVDRAGAGGRPLNLARAPFHFPEPLARLHDGADTRLRFLGVWRTDDVRAALVRGV
jgi:SAM-dependent methyltransferase